MKVIYSNQNLIDNCYQMIEDIERSVWSNFPKQPLGSSKSLLHQDLFDNKLLEIEERTKLLYTQIEVLQMTNKLTYVKER